MKKFFLVRRLLVAAVFLFGAGCMVSAHAGIGKIFKKFVKSESKKYSDPEKKQSKICEAIKNAIDPHGMEVMDRSVRRPKPVKKAKLAHYEEKWRGKISNYLSQCYSWGNAARIDTIDIRMEKVDGQDIAVYKWNIHKPKKILFVNFIQGEGKYILCTQHSRFDAFDGACGERIQRVFKKNSSCFFCGSSGQSKNSTSGEDESLWE